MRLPFLALFAFVMAAAPVQAAPGPDALLFTRHDGLSGSGAVVARWLERARLHGIDLAPDAVIASYVAHTADGMILPDEQAAVERTLAFGLERLVAELPAVPRTVEVLADPETGAYLSPDVAWRGAAPPTASAEALAAARRAALDGTLEAHLAALLPAHPQYALLVAAAEHYLELCASGGWEMVAAPRMSKKKVPDPEATAAIQRRLAREGFYRGEASGLWDAATEAAADAFRRARQVPARGPDDQDLIVALNVPCDARLATLMLNARRWRHSAWRGEPTRVEVNLAAQELRYLRDGALVMTQRTIVGSTKWYFERETGRKVFMNPSPILHDHISRVIVNPIWAVPPKIAKNEIDAKVAEDPTYLEKNRMQLVTSARGRTYIQSPGPDNALGVIKILFPNSESVYLHDTPKKAGFKLAVRALSHGCVRVQNALDFGLALLAADAETAGRAFDAEALRRRAGHTGSIIHDLTTQVPVFLEYYTASVDDAGVVRFHPDIYEYDVESLGGVVGQR